MKNTRFITVLAVLLFLSGCMFPQEERAENQVPFENQLNAVQVSVNQYKEDNGVLPIQTKDQDTPIYQKYVIDFRKLMPRYIQNPPGNSFENGGPYQYVIIDPENQGVVKVIDLRVMGEIQQLQREVNEYIRNNEYAPIKEPIGPGVYEIDAEKLDYHRDLKVKSPYHETTYLPLVINEQGQVRIDYAIDLNIALQEYDHDYKTGDDIRKILTDHSPIVPVFSVPYTLDENEEPIFKQE